MKALGWTLQLPVGWVGWGVRHRSFWDVNAGDVTPRARVQLLLCGGRTHGRGTGRCRRPSPSGELSRARASAPGGMPEAPGSPVPAACALPPRGAASALRAPGSHCPLGALGPASLAGGLRCPSPQAALPPARSRGLSARPVPEPRPVVPAPACARSPRASGRTAPAQLGCSLPGRRG